MRASAAPAPAAGGLEHLHQPGARPLSRGRFRGGPGHGEHGALHRLLDGLVGAGRGPAQTVDQDGGVDVFGIAAFGVAYGLGQAPQDLRQNDTRVAPRSDQRSVADGVRHGGHVGVVPPGQLPYHRLEGERHVRPGVTVGDRVDIEPVDGFLVGAQDVPIGDDRGDEVFRLQALQRLHGRDANLIDRPGRLGAASLGFGCDPAPDGADSPTADSPTNE